MAKQRAFMVIENEPYETDKQIICKKYLGLRNGMPWRIASQYAGFRLISYNSNGDYRGLRDHGAIDSAKFK